MHQLVMPPPLSRLKIDGDKALAKQSVAGPVGAKVIPCRQFDRQIYQTKFFIDGDLGPNAGVAGIGVGIFFPAVVPIFGTDRNGMEDPETFARAHIKSTNVSFYGTKAVGIGPGCMCGPDNNDIASDDRCSMQSDFSTERIDDLIVFHLQIHNAADAEARYRRTSLRIQSDQAITRRHVENSLFGTVGPVRESTTR